MFRISAFEQLLLNYCASEWYWQIISSIHGMLQSKNWLVLPFQIRPSKKICIFTTPCVIWPQINRKPCGTYREHARTRKLRSANVCFLQRACLDPKRSLRQTFPETFAGVDSLLHEDMWDWRVHGKSVIPNPLPSKRLSHIFFSIHVSIRVQSNVTARFHYGLSNNTAILQVFTLLAFIYMENTASECVWRSWMMLMSSLKTKTDDRTM